MDKLSIDTKLFNEVCFGLPNIEFINKLLSKGADIKVIVDGESVLSGLLFFNKDCSNLSDIVKLLLKKGANPNLDTSQGFNCLYDACLINDPKIVAILLEAGTDYNCTCQDTGESLMDWALGEQFFLTTVLMPENHEKNHDKIVKLLRLYNAKSSIDLI
tara:strand:+ start:6825 stop:7301 length:477 start_codon:yes stop_codon:yes gene_type:complete